ncbi:hypothetical protein F5883DRAFT_123072 [Diaporthe sp. PMI_573]|nr:hypothetical protein F5883DRAFT_123072 [Diaporthaceae sp. PMI_573]
MADPRVTRQLARCHATQDTPRHAHMYGIADEIWTGKKWTLPGMLGPRETSADLSNSTLHPSPSCSRIFFIGLSLCLFLYRLGHSLLAHTRCDLFLLVALPHRLTGSPCHHGSLCAREQWRACLNCPRESVENGISTVPVGSTWRAPITQRLLTPWTPAEDAR